jgi:hypothetical protein
MTLLGLYRVLGFKGSVSFDTITKPGKVLSGETIVGFQRFLHDRFYVEASAKYGRNPMLDQALTRNKKGKWFLWSDFMSQLEPRMFPIAKSGASAGSVKPEDNEGRETAYVSSSLPALASAARTWLLPKHSELLATFKEWLSHTGQPVRIIRRPASNKIAYIEYDLPLIPLLEQFAKSDSVPNGPSHLGRLSLKEEAAGKIRVFAMVDAFTQWALYPLHKAIMSTIARWPSDGTFDQLAPVRRLLKRKGVTGLWSYDLSAATDRLPLIVQRIMLQPILGLHGAEAWGDLLSKRDYSYKNVSYRYSVGQPMGAYSSWAMLALTHHALVQWAYFRLCTRVGIRYKWFELYAILGDDVIIGDSGVAAEYLAVMDSLGVEIGLAKSLVSPNKLVGEFAKKFFIPSDASMVPVKEIIAAKYSGSELVQLVMKYKLSVQQALSLAGFGYKVKGSLNKEFSKLGLRSVRLLLALSHPSGPLACGWTTWLQSKGWNMPGPRLSKEAWLDFFRRRIDVLKDSIQSRVDARKTVFTMMMVKRDHGNRYNPWDHLYPVYDLILARLDGYTYEISEIEKAVKALEDNMSSDLVTLFQIQDLERRLAALPKPDDFSTRAPASSRRVDAAKAFRLWRDAAKCRTINSKVGKPKGSTPS